MAGGASLFRIAVARDVFLREQEGVEGIEKVNKIWQPINIIDARQTPRTFSRLVY